MTKRKYKFTPDWDQVPICICGIPCFAEVTFAQKWPGSCAQPTGGWDYDYRILSRDGRHAPWLERKITESIHRDILHDIEIAMQKAEIV